VQYLIHFQYSSQIYQDMVWLFSSKKSKLNDLHIAETCKVLGLPYLGISDLNIENVSDTAQYMYIVNGSLFLNVSYMCIKILLWVNIGLTGKIEEKISITIIQICMHCVQYDHIWLHLLKDLNLNFYDHIWNLFRLNIFLQKVKVKWLLHIAETCKVLGLP
jgi:hypothetical protein